MSVYFVHNRSANAVKIGFSGNAKSRIAALQTSSPDNLTLLAVIDGEIADEQALHQRFDHLKIRNEWFRAAEELNVVEVKHGEEDWSE